MELIKSPVFVTDIVGLQFSPEELGQVEDGEQTSGTEEPSIGEEEEEPMSLPSYIYYISGDTLLRVNPADTSDTSEIRKPGAVDMTVDEDDGVLYYIYLDRFIVQAPVAEGQMKYLVRSLGKITSLVVDPKDNVLYFTNEDGTVKSFNVETSRETVLLQGRDSPQKVVLSPPTDDGVRKLIWVEGDDTASSTVVTAPVTPGSNVVTIGRYPDITGEETSLSKTPAGDTYYFIRDSQIFQLSPDSGVTPITTSSPALSVTATPAGLLYTTPDNEVVYLDPSSETPEKVVMVTSSPVDALLLQPDSPLLAPPSRTTYLYYISKGALVKVSREDPEDRVEVSRPGGSLYKVDTQNRDIFYVVFNRAIVKENLETDQTDNIVTG